MRFGVCVGGDAGRIQIAKKYGFDYVESAFEVLAKDDPSERQTIVAELKKHGIGCEAVNCFLPGSLPVTGTSVNYDALRDYVGRGMENGEKLGVKTVVFGSGGARRIPEGFPFDRAIRQLAEFLSQIAGPLAADHGICIAVEPLCDSNVINTVKEGAMLCAMAGHPNVRALGDLYHMEAVHDKTENLLLLSGMMQHAHVAEPSKRVYPSPDDGYDYRPFLNALETAGCPRCSVEAGTKDFERDAALAIRALRKE